VPVAYTAPGTVDDSGRKPQLMGYLGRGVIQVRDGLNLLY